MNKRGISPIVGTVLMILLVIIGTSAVFVSVRELSQQTSSAPILQQCLALNIRAENCIIDEKNELISIRVSRGAGGGDISIIKILFNTPSGLKAQEEMVSLNPLDSKVFIYDLSEFSETEDVDVLGVIDGNLCRATGSPVKCVSGIIDDPEPPIVLTEISDFRVILQREYTNYPNLGDVCANNKAVALSSGQILCSNSSLTNSLNNPSASLNDLIGAFADTPKKDVIEQLSNSATNNGIDLQTTDYMMLNCEEPVLLGRWGNYNGDVDMQNKIFKGAKIRVEAAREVFPNAIISLGPSIRGLEEYNPTAFNRIEAHKRAGVYGVYDAVDCLEPRIFHNQGPDDLDKLGKPVTWMEDMTRMALDVSTNDIKNSVGDNFDLCVVSSWLVYNDNSNSNNNNVQLEFFLKQLDIVQEYSKENGNIKFMGWWGPFNSATHAKLLDDSELCEYS